MAYYHQENVDEEALIKRLQDLAKRYKKFQEELGRYKEKKFCKNYEEKEVK